MTKRIHISICQPPGYVHSLGFIDIARYARYQFRRLGAEVSIGKNRLREDSINIVLGAHLGFSTDLLQRHVCVFWNLEQLGQGGASVSAEYLALLSKSAVIDYDSRNLAAYGCRDGEVPVVTFMHAPYLRQPSLAIHDRPIDLLFIGGVNDRRAKLIQRIEASGWNVTRFDAPLYGEDRDHFIRQSKAVFNCHFYESSRFEQTRAFHVLSLGTPVISERTQQTSVPAQYERAVEWVEDEVLENFFNNEFMTPEWIERAGRQLDYFAEQDDLQRWQTAFQYCQSYLELREQSDAGLRKVWMPSRMNLGSGKDYKAGWLNVDILERAKPDIVLDLSKPIQWPIQMSTEGGGQVCIKERSLDHVYANNVLEHVPDLVSLMTNILLLLKEDGIFEIEVPYEKAPSAWQDPTHVRAMNRQSWIYYTDWFWYLGWFNERFVVRSFNWMNQRSEDCEEFEASFMRIVLQKTVTSAQERMIARTMHPDFFSIPEDL